MALISLAMPTRIRRRIDEWVERHSPTSPDCILLHNRRLYILPTRFGYLFATMLFVLFLAAINYQNSMAFVLTFTLTALGIVSLWYTHKNLLNLEISLQTPRPVFKGESSEFIFLLKNPNNSTRYAIGLQYGQETPVYLTVPPEGSAEARLSLTTVRRGQFGCKGITIFTRYPTGLFHAWGWLRFELPILVYPKPSTKAVLQKSLTEQYHGKAATSTIEGDDFAGSRTSPGRIASPCILEGLRPGKRPVDKNFSGSCTTFTVDRLVGYTARFA